MKKSTFAATALIFTFCLSSCININIDSGYVRLDETKAQETPMTPDSYETLTTEPETSVQTDTEHIESDTTAESEEMESVLEETAASTEMHFTGISSPVSKNNYVTVSVKGLPNTEYGIKVFYISSQSSAAGLENKFSDSQGIVNWRWKIGPAVKDGKYKITVTCGEDEITGYLEVK